MSVEEICAVFDRCAADLLWQDMAPYFRAASAKLRAAEKFAEVFDMEIGWNNVDNAVGKAFREYEEVGKWAG